MKIAFLFLVSIALAYAVPVDNPDKESRIVKSAFDQEPAGPYNFNFETENAINREESGSIKTAKDEDGKDVQFLVMSGSYSYTDPEGKVITVQYTADENGFHPVGDHLPQVPS